MNKSILINLLLCSFIFSSCALAQQEPVKGEKKALNTQKEKASYSIGWDIGKNIKSQGVDVDAKLLAQGINDSIAGTEALLSYDEMQRATMMVQQEIQKKRDATAGVSGDKNTKEGKLFLSQNKAKSGVKTTVSGLQYKVIKNGSGAKPKATDTVTVNYEGKTIDGTVFDSSYKRGQPATFALNQVIKGWTEGVQLMNAGSTYEFYIPSELAYGASGAGGTIGPNATLIFKVELISVGK